MSLSAVFSNRNLLDDFILLVDNFSKVAYLPICGPKGKVKIFCLFFCILEINFFNEIIYTLSPLFGWASDYMGFVLLR